VKGKIMDRELRDLINWNEDQVEYHMDLKNSFQVTGHEGEGEEDTYHDDTAMAHAFTAKRLREEGFTPVEDELPPADVPVWMLKDGYLSIGVLGRYGSSPPEWIYAKDPSYDSGRWNFDRLILLKPEKPTQLLKPEKPTHWKYLIHPKQLEFFDGKERNCQESSSVVERDG